MLYGRALVQQQGLKLLLLDVIESVKHNSKELQRGQDRKSCFDPYTLHPPEPVLLKRAETPSLERQGDHCLQEEFTLALGHRIPEVF